MTIDSSVPHFHQIRVALVTNEIDINYLSTYLNLKLTYLT